jgi:hypothetical protein
MKTADVIRLLVLAFAPFAPVRRALTIEVVGCLLALVVLCSAVAYVLYYRLIANVGPAKAYRHIPHPGVRHLAGRSLSRGEGDAADARRLRHRYPRHRAGRPPAVKTRRRVTVFSPHRPGAHVRSRVW